MTPDWKQLSSYLPDPEEALVRYALTFTMLLLGLGLVMAVSAAGIMAPMTESGMMKRIAEDVGFAVAGLVGFTLAIELRASAKGWPVFGRVIAVLALFVVVLAGLIAPYLFPGYVGGALFFEPHLFAVSGLLMMLAASASGVGHERANVRITVFMTAALLAWLTAYLGGYLIHSLFDLRGSWNMRAANMPIITIIALTVGLGLVARWLPDANDSGQGDDKTEADPAQLARTILPPKALSAIRYIILIVFLIASLLIMYAIFHSTANGRLVRPDQVPILSAPAASFLGIMSGFLAFVWPYRDRSRLFSMLGRVMLPVLVVGGILVTGAAVYFEYITVTQTPLTDPVKQAGHLFSSAKNYKLMLNWSIAGAVLLAALGALLWWRGRDLRLFTGLLSLFLLLISVGPLSVNSSYAHRINKELTPLLQQYALDDQNRLRARKEIEWTPESALVARALVMRLAGAAALGNLPVASDERRQLFGNDLASLLPAKRLNTALERLNLDAANIARRRPSSTNFHLHFRSRPRLLMDVAGYHQALRTQLDQRHEVEMDGRQVRHYWKLQGNGELRFDIENWITARFDLRPILEDLLQKEQEKRRIRELNVLARQTGGEQIEAVEDKPRRMEVLDSQGDGGRFRLQLHGLRAAYENGKYRDIRGHGLLLIKKAALDALPKPAAAQTPAASEQ